MQHMLNDRLTCDKVVSLLTEPLRDPTKERPIDSNLIELLLKNNPSSEVLIIHKGKIEPLLTCLADVTLSKRLRRFEKTYSLVEKYTSELKIKLSELEVVKRMLKDSTLLLKFSRTVLALSAVLIDTLTELLRVNIDTLDRLSSLFIKWSKELDRVYCGIKSSSRGAWAPRLIQQLVQLVQDDVKDNIEIRILGSLITLLTTKIMLTPGIRIGDFTNSLIEFLEDIYKSNINKDIAYEFSKPIRCEFYAYIASIAHYIDIYNVNVLVRSLTPAAAFLILSMPEKELRVDLALIYYVLVHVLPVNRGRVTLGIYKYSDEGKRFVSSIRPFILEMLHTYYMLKLITNTSENLLEKPQYIFTPYVVLSYFFYNENIRKHAELTEISEYATDLLRRYCTAWISLLKVFSRSVSTILKNSIIISDEREIRNLIEVCEKDDTKYFLYTSDAGILTLDALARYCTNFITFMRSFVTKPVSLRYWWDVVGKICVL